jgi:outer membrane protein with beta-barrel domain
VATDYIRSDSINHSPAGAMRSHARLGTAVWLLTAPLSAAVAQEQRSTVGAELGYSRSDLRGADATGVSARQGALTGVYLDAPLVGRLSFRPELLFALKGGRATTDLEGGGTALLDIELAYLEMPILLKLTPLRRRIRPVLFAGPAPALQIGCDFQVILPNQPVSATCAEAGFSVRDLDVGLVAGAGMEIRWGQSALALETRYTSGLRSILKGAEVRNRAFGVVFVLTF